MNDANLTSGTNLKKLTKSELRQMLEEALEKIQTINSQYGDVSYKSAEIERAYQNLYNAENPIALKAEEATEKIQKFHGQLDSEIKPDIQTTRNELSGLLGSATLATLASAYQEAKIEYSRAPEKSYKGLKFFGLVFTFLYNTIWRNLDFLFSYAFFVLPLLAICLVFLYEGTAKVVLDALTISNTIPTAAELIYIKTIISLPLIWLAWYGQRNISQRKRMFEEYNHKLRVVQMYTLFTSDQTSYQLEVENNKKMESLLIDTIGHNASKVFGMDETILDKIKEIIRAHRGDFEDQRRDEVK